MTMNGLYPKIMLPIGGVFAIMMVTIVTFVYVSGSRQIEQEGLDRAEMLNRMAFEALYASMSQGGGREGNRRTIANLQNLDLFDDLRVVKGDPVVQQFGAEPDELPQDELDRQALTGEVVQQIRWEDGYRVIRYVTPLRAKVECQPCHQVQIGAINGAISTEISLREIETALLWRRNVLLLVLGGGLLALGLLIFYTLQRLIIMPLQTIQQGTKAIAKGKLSHHLQVHTGDEMEAVANEFNQMARRLQESYGLLSEEQNKLIAAIESSRDPIWISDTNHNVVMVNSALEQMTGRRRENLLGQNCRHLMGVHTLDNVSICDSSCPFQHPTHGNGKVEGCMPTASGKEAWIEISYGNVIDQDNDLAGVIHIVHDLTERKKVERLKDEFISMVSHELRTPLHHIKGFATTLLQTDVEWDEDTQYDFLESINRESDRLNDLVEKILRLSRLEADDLPLEKGWCQVSELMDDVLQRRRSLIADRQIHLHQESNLPPLFIGDREIEVVLTNLIENAIKYSSPDTTIMIMVTRQADQVVFSVVDRGIGIAPEEIGFIFNRFYRVKSEGRRMPGAGLGLAICKCIVEMHRGRIWVESTPDVGSRFFFSLPVDQDSQAQEASPQLIQLYE